MSGAVTTSARLLVAAAVVSTCVLFVKDAADPVNVVKLSAVAACAALLLAAVLADAVRSRVVRLPWSAAAAAGAALLLAFLASYIVAPQSTVGLLGTAGRNSGLLAYGSATLIFLLSLRVFDAPSTSTIALAVALAGLFTSLYGGLQYLGVDAIPWNNPFNPIIASLGNPDFAAGYLGIAAPAAAWAALWTRWAAPWRILAAVTAVLCMLVALLSSAVLGPIAGAAGLAVLGLAWVLDQSGKVRTAGFAALGAAALLGLLGLVAGLAGTGPAAAFFSGISYRARTWYWSAALEMWQRRPLLGVGLDAYGTYWWRDRPLAAPQQLGGDHFSDSAHSVPLQHLAQGGLLLAGAYVALVVVTAACLVRGLRRLRGQQRLLLGGLGGAWVAYQVQSLVSIDQVPLLTVHLALAAGVVVASGSSPTRTFRLPGAAPVVAEQPTRGRRRAVLPPRPRPLTGLDVALLGVVAVLALAALWQAFVPLRASRAVYAGDAALAAGDGTTAVARYERAIDLVPGWGPYRAKRASAYNSAGQADLALAGFLDTVRSDPYDIGATRNAAALAESRGDLATAERLNRRALTLDPSNSSTILGLAGFQLRHGQAREAGTLLETWTPKLPAVAALWASLGDARAVLGATQRAREAYQHALDLQPGEPVATAGLAKLEQQGA